MSEVIASKRPEIDCINVVKLTGSVVHKYRPRPDVIILTVAVTGKDIHEADYPNVVFYGDEAESIDKGIVVEEKNYPRVSIEGIIQTSRKELPDGTVRFYQNVVGTSISRTQTNMEKLSGLRGVGSRKVESENDVCIMGRVTNVYPITREGADRPIGAIVTMRTVVNGRVNYPRVTCFNKHVEAAMNLKRDDIVCATGFMETTNRDGADGKRLRYESVIATELQKVEEPAE